MFEDLSAVRICAIRRADWSRVRTVARGLPHGGGVRFVPLATPGRQMEGHTAQAGRRPRLAAWPARGSSTVSLPPGFTQENMYGLHKN